MRTRLASAVRGSARAMLSAEEGEAEDLALRRVAMLVTAAAPLEDLFPAVCREAADLLRAPVAAVLRHEAGGTASVVAARGSSAALAHTLLVRGDLSLPMRMEMPVSVNGLELGVLAAGWLQPGRIRPRSQSRLARLADLTAIAIANAESRSELAASRARIIATADQARRRLERDLHDGAQQRLVMLALDLQAAEAAVPPELRQVKAQLSRAVADVASAVSELQEIAQGIHPVILSHAGLRPALKGLIRRSPIPVHRRLALDRRLPENYEVALYYLVAEALTNVIKHAAARAVWLDVWIERSSVKISVRDDGVGGATPDGGSGLVGLRDRIEALGGWLGIESPQGAGTTLAAGIPLPVGRPEPSAPSWPLWDEVPTFDRGGLSARARLGRSRLRAQPPGVYGGDPTPLL